MTVTLLWIATALLMLVGLAGTVLPVLPGTALIVAGAVLGAWIDGFARVGGGTLTAIALLGVLAWVLEYVAGLLGAKKAGASREALIGAAVGTVLGLLMGLVGVLFMPFVGAAVGEYWARRQHGQALKVGFATGLGLALGLVAKVVLGFLMVGLFVAALIL